MIAGCCIVVAFDSLTLGCLRVGVSAVIRLMLCYVDCCLALLVCVISYFSCGGVIMGCGFMFGCCGFAGYVLAILFVYVSLLLVLVS